MNRKLEIVITELEVITQLRKVAAVLAWDQETYMPSGSAQARSEQISLVLSLSHARFTSDTFRQSLATLVDLDGGAIDRDGLDRSQVRLLENVWHDWRRATALPVEFVGELARLTSQAQHVWQEARAQNDYARFSPYLEKIIDMKRQEARFHGFEDEPYDALLEDYEMGITTKQIEQLFAVLRPALIELVGRIKSSKVPDRHALLTQEFPEDQQWEFGMEVLSDMGYDFTKGRQDRSAHPFTTDFHPSDVRITTRLNARDLSMGLFGTIHEGGHALYEQGLEAKYFGTPLCEAISLGIHESQSRLWENYVGRSMPFWRHYYPRLQARFPGQLGAVPLDDFYAAINAVRPSLIRVEADEVTYNLHIMLRFDLERALLNGDVTVKDLPGLWDQAMAKYVGVTPSTVAEGVLQDIHWGMGAIGYFPTYMLGNLYGRQIYEAALAQIDDLEERIAQGDLLTLREWLRDNVHRLGRLKRAGELIQDLTGQPLSAGPFIKYLQAKYERLYDL